MAGLRTVSPPPLRTLVAAKWTGYTPIHRFLQRSYWAKNRYDSIHAFTSGRRYGVRLGHWICLKRSFRLNHTNIYNEEGNLHLLCIIGEQPGDRRTPKFSHYRACEYTFISPPCQRWQGSRNTWALASKMRPSKIDLPGRMPQGL